MEKEVQGRDQGILFCLRNNNHLQKKQDIAIDKQVSGVNDKETIASLKREIDYLRSKNEQMMTLMKKNNETHATVTPASPSPVTPEIDINGNDILTKNVNHIDFVIK